MTTQTVTTKHQSRASQFWALTKPRVTQLAVFCAVIGMFLGTPEGLPDWQIVRRPDEEVCLWTWYDKENDSWDVLTLEERMEVNNTLTEQIVMNVLEGLNNSLT